MFRLPRQLLLGVRLPDHALADPAADLTARLDATLGSDAWQGLDVAVGVGSRGISRLPVVVETVVAWVRRRGGRPFVMPVMGSHGGATAAGQVGVLASLGITEATVGAPIRSAMETAIVGRSPLGTDVHVAQTALDAGAVILINRVKPHTDFVSDRTGSGLLKMIAIGLGKVNGARACHGAARTRGLETAVQDVGPLVIGTLPRLYGVALVEDAHHALGWVDVLHGREFLAREPELLQRARGWMPALPFRDIDVLVVDEIGKEFSGAGMDPNITNRGVEGRRLDDAGPSVGAIYVRDLSEATHGNAIGVGLADVVHARLVPKIDAEVTYTNALTAMKAAPARIPMHFASDALCLQAALRLAGAEPASARIVRIANTLALDRVVCSEACAGDVAGRADLEVLVPSRDWPLTSAGAFEPEGDLLALAAGSRS